MINQRQIKNFNYSTLSDIKSASGRDNEISYCIETETSYRYLSAGSAYTANDEDILATGDGGNTRWLGVGGRYGTFQGLKDVQTRMLMGVNYLG